MVQRKTAEVLEEFDGMVSKIEIVPDQINEGQEQYHLEMTPDDKEMLKESKTGKFHVWIRKTKTTKEDSIAEGSILDRYITEIEAVFKEAKQKQTIFEALSVMKNVRCHFIRKTLGKKYKGFDSKPIFVPQRQL